MSLHWSNLAKIVYRRTYARHLGDDRSMPLEKWPQTIERVIRGNLALVSPDQLMPNEGEILERLMLERKAMPAGRGLWFSGAAAHKRIGGAGVNNCWYFSMDDWRNFAIIQDMLMLGGGVGASVERQFIEKLPAVKTDVQVQESHDEADFFVSDSREGWCELTHRIFEAFFITGKSFKFSVKHVRPAGLPINGFGGISSGPAPLVQFAYKIAGICHTRAGYQLRPIDVADIVCATGEMVVAGNVRRSAIILLGDAWDEQYLIGKRWDLGPIPNQRACANWSVVASSAAELGPLFWATYENGEPFGIVNRENIQRYGRMGELNPDTAVGVNPCAEATLESGESCNLWEQNLFNIQTPEEFLLSSKMGMRYTKRVSLERYDHEISAKIIAKNRRVGLGITGCLAAPGLFNPDVLDTVYQAILREDREYSAVLDVNESKRHTVVKPSGTLSKKMDTPLFCGIHGAYSQHIIQRIRFAANDPLVPLLRAAGHPLEYVERFDGSLDTSTVVAEFYLEAPEGAPCVDAGFDTWRQLDTLLMAQRHWADQAVSVTVYYKKQEIPEVKAWIAENLNKIKTISFLCYEDHGFKQAPWEAISEAQYREKSSKIRDINLDNIDEGALESQECAGGACPIR